MDLKENELACSEREFGFSLVKWKIKNYFTATCQENWIIRSPAFVVKAKVPTKWQLSLQSVETFGKYSVLMFLERQEYDSFTDVRVSWKLSYPYSTSGMKLIGDTDFEDRTFVGIEICDLHKLDKKLLIKKKDTLTIRFLILVYPKDGKTYSRPRDKGLKSLSQDLMVLCRINKNPDIEVHVNGLPTKAHKAVLSSRNKVLKDAIEGKDFIELTDLDFEVTKDVFGYLYTGNLNYVLRRPSFAILDCIKYLEIKELESYYRCDKLTLVTNIEVKEYTFNWEIQDRSFSDFVYLSPLFKEDELQVTFRLYFYPKRFKKKDGNAVIFFEVVEGSLPQSAYAELIISESFSKCNYVQVTRLSVISDASAGFESIFPRHVVEDLRLATGQIMISCTIRLPKGSESLSTVETKTDSSTLIDSEQHYELLSAQIASLFETGMYSDFTIICENVCFKVHSCILSARSYTFRCVFEDLKHLGVKCFMFSGIRSRIMKDLLFNIYSGKFLVHEITDVLTIYKLAEKVRLLPLKYSCSSILQNNINAQNAWYIFQLADKYKDHKLKSVALKLICCG